MIDFYYIIGLGVFLTNFWVLMNWFKISRIREWIKAYILITKKDPNKSNFKTLGDYNTILFFGVSIIIDFIWNVLGTLTQHWVIFSLILLVFFITRSLLNLTKSSPKLNNILEKWIYFILIGGKALIQLSLIMNNFHGIQILPIF
jgi:hypothetical protein